MRNLLKKFILGQEWLRRYAVGYCTNNKLFGDVFLLSDPNYIRDCLNLPKAETAAQLNQDIFALLMNRFSKGFFLEIGANDGYTLSNTHYLEQNFGWTGLLVEPNPRYLEPLKFRKSMVCRKAVTKEIGLIEFTDAGLYGGVTSTLAQAHQDITKAAAVIHVETDTLPNILHQFNAPKQIDFISIDVEGAEISIVEQMISCRDYVFVCGCIEHGNRMGDKHIMIQMLEEAGFKVLMKENSTQDIFFVNVDASKAIDI